MLSWFSFSIWWRSQWHSVILVCSACVLFYLHKLLCLFFHLCLFPIFPIRINHLFFPLILDVDLSLANLLNLLSQIVFRWGLTNSDINIILIPFSVNYILATHDQYHSQLCFISQYISNTNPDSQEECICILICMGLG